MIKHCKCKGCEKTIFFDTDVTHFRKWCDRCNLIRVKQRAKEKAKERKAVSTELREMGGEKVFTIMERGAERTLKETSAILTAMHKEFPTHFEKCSTEQVRLIEKNALAKLFKMMRALDEPATLPASPPQLTPEAMRLINKSVAGRVCYKLTITKSKQ